MPGGLFVSHRQFLAGSTGGVQACTREYAAAIEAAGIDLTLVPFDGDRRLSTRVLRRIDSSPYFRPVEPSLFAAIRARVETSPVDCIFLNQATLAPIAGRLREFVPDATPIVLLSHGLESTDLRHLIRLRRRLPLSGRLRPTAQIVLSRATRVEASARAHVDAVFALSPLDAELERSIGSPNVDWLPRTITATALDWRPSGSRLGYVGTLDHAPNLEGLASALRAIAGSEAGALRVRIIGGPQRIGVWLAKRFPCADFLGNLDDADLAREASSWTGFIHPIFCQPRGCSTKLATAIGWRIPIVTTPQGRRGYVWSEGSLVEAEEPEAFARQALSLFNPDFAAAARAEVARVAASSPTLSDVAAKIRFLLGLPGLAL